MITGIFGEPGAGKTSILAWYIKKNKNNKRYKHIYTINAQIDGAEEIKWEDYSLRYLRYLRFHHRQRTEVRTRRHPGDHPGHARVPEG